MKKRVYYIYVPTLRGRSAGVRVLCKLCAKLRELGEESYLAVPSVRQPTYVFDGVSLPILDARQIYLHVQDAREVIGVYPEIVLGNPLNAHVVARYILNWPGVLGGDASFDKSELLFAYTRVLASIDAHCHVLNLSVVSRETFYNRGYSQRNNVCFYAGKYRSLGGIPTGLPSGAIEIVGSGPKQQTPAEIAELFNRSLIFFTFEDTLLCEEAALCGCPTIFIPNEIFSAPFGDFVGGRRPAIYGESNAELLARVNCAYIVSDLEEREVLSVKQLEEFVRITKNAPAKTRKLRLFVSKSNGFVTFREIYSVLAFSIKLPLGSKLLFAVLRECLSIKLMFKIKRGFFSCHFYYRIRNKV